MPVPKKKTSKSRRNMRRSHHARAVAHHARPCPQCSEPVMMHQVCRACGFYRGKEIIEVPIE